MFLGLFILLTTYLSLSCQVHVGTPIDQCVANNGKRIRCRNEKQEAAGGKNHLERDRGGGGGGEEEEEEEKDDNFEEEPYPPELLDNLIFRYEEPSTHSRWDRPLFTVPWIDPEPPAAAILNALTGLTLPSPATSSTAMPTLTSSMASTSISDTASLATGVTGTTTTLGSSRTGNNLSRPRVRQHLSTVQAPATDSSTLYGLEKRTSAIVAAIRDFTLAHPSAEAAIAQQQRQNGDGQEGIRIPVPEASEDVFIPAYVAVGGTSDELAGAGGILSLPRLQRLKRQWVSLNRAYVGANYGPGTLSLDQVGDAFVRFLNADFGHDE